MAAISTTEPSSTRCFASSIAATALSHPDAAVAGKPHDYESVYQGPGEPLGTRSVYALLAFAVPLLVVVGLLARLFNLRLLGYGAWGLAAVAVMALIGGYIASRLKGQRNAI
jgi:hypothetical protein